MNAEEQKEICVFCANPRPIRGLGGFGAGDGRAPGDKVSGERGHCGERPPSLSGEIRQEQAHRCQGGAAQPALHLMRSSRTREESHPQGR